MMTFTLAWRNLWRNRRRSFITIASILFAVFFAVFMRALQLGTYDVMIKNSVGMFTGYIQLHQDGYWNDQTINNTFAYRSSLEDSLLSNEQVTHVSPRLESFALSAHGDQTKGALVIGIHPEKEKVLDLESQLEKGQLLAPEDKGILVSEGLAEYYTIGLNDTLVLLGQGYHGMSAAGKYFIKGIVKFKSPALNENTVVLSLSEAQWLYSTGNRLTSFVIGKENFASADQVAQELQTYVGDTYEVMDWQTMLPELVQSIEADSAGGLIMLYILYMIISFGIFGTILMMTAERRYEFGVMLSIGMKRWRISAMVLIETIFLAILGVIAGMVLVYPFIYYFNIHPFELTGDLAKTMTDVGFEPIIPTSLDPTIALNHAAIILVISVVLSIYPSIQIHKLKPVEAMRL